MPEHIPPCTAPRNGSNDVKVKATVSLHLLGAAQGACDCRGPRWVRNAAAGARSRVKGGSEDTERIHILQAFDFGVK